MARGFVRKMRAKERARRAKLVLGPNLSAKSLARKAARKVGNAKVKAIIAQKEIRNAILPRAYVQQGIANYDVDRRAREALARARGEMRYR